MRKWNCSRIGKYIFAISLGLCIWLGLAAFLLSFASIGGKEGIDFIWQMVGFSFLLATFVYSVNPQSLKKGQNKKIAGIGIAFILSGVFIIVGYGIAMVAAKAEPSITQMILKWMSSGFTLIATFSLSWGMTMMTLGFMGED